MPKSQGLDKTAVRKEMVELLSRLLSEAGEEVLQVKGNILAIPRVDGDGNEYTASFTVSIPAGSRDGEEYDPYALAEDYKLRQEEVAFKQKQRAERTLQETEERARRREALQAKKLEEEERRLRIREEMIKAQIKETGKK